MKAEDNKFPHVTVLELAASPGPAPAGCARIWRNSVDDKLYVTDDTGTALEVGTSTDAEAVRDIIASALVAGTNVTVTVDDASDTITIAATGGGSTDAEVVRDTIAAALVAGAGVSITVDDAGDTITITNTGATSRSINPQTGTAYTLATPDAGKFVTMTNAAASSLTIPANATVAFPVGTFIEGAQLGAGQVTITGASGVTVNASPGLKVAAQYGTFGLLKTGTDTWLAMGRLSA